MSDIKVKLSKPIMDMDNEVTEIVFREPEFGDLLACSDPENEMLLLATIIEKCGNVSQPAVKKIKIKDIKKIGEALEPFLDL